jgi:hypothetical protein
VLIIMMIISVRLSKEDVLTVLQASHAHHRTSFVVRQFAQQLYQQLLSTALCVVQCTAWACIESSVQLLIGAASHIIETCEFNE